MFFISLILWGFPLTGHSSLKGKKNKIPFSEALPEDISNENFPDIVESFDYPNITLMELAEAIGKLTGLNFIIDSSAGLSGKRVKIIAPSKITVAEAYKAFLSTLAANGFTLVKKGAFWKITLTKQALKDNIEIYSGDYFPNTDQLITRIMKLKYINAKQFADSIKFYMSQENAISHNEETNSVIITDYGSVIEKITKLSLKMDVPGSIKQIQIIPIQYADAGTIGDLLNQLIFQKSRPSSSSQRRGRGGKFKVPPAFSSAKSKKQEGNIEIAAIIPDERTNSLVVSANTEGLKRVKNLVKRLDTYVDPIRNGGVHVYKVLYGTASQLYSTLTGMSKGQGQTASPTEGSRRVSYRRPVGRSSGGKFQSPLFDNITIMVDNQINSLIISAKNRFDLERVKAVLKKIDIPRDQVFVQAVIVEAAVSKGDHWEVNLMNAVTQYLTQVPVIGDIISGDKDNEKDDLIPIAGFLNKKLSLKSLSQGTEFGPGLAFGFSLPGLINRFGLNANQNNPITPAQLKTIDSEKRDDVLISVGRANNDISTALNLSIFPLIQILKKAGNFNILSAPQITAMDNVQAFIEVGENAPVGLSTTTNSGSLAVGNNVVRDNVTIKLDITPSINADSGTVQMKIIQTLKDFSTRQSTASELRNRGVHILTRNIDTTLVLNDGETAVLGGLMVEKETKDESKVPILGDIPILGWLFKGSIREKQKHNLLVFITPTILRGKSQKRDTQRILGKKLEERIHFVKKYMKGRDPYGEFLDNVRKSHVLKDISSDKTESNKSFIPVFPQKKELESLPDSESNEMDSSESFSDEKGSAEIMPNNEYKEEEEYEEETEEEAKSEEDEVEEKGDKEGEEKENDEKKKKNIDKIDSLKGLSPDKEPIFEEERNGEKVFTEILPTNEVPEQVEIKSLEQEEN